MKRGPAGVLLIVIVLAALIAVAWWHTPDRAPPTPWASGTECPAHDPGNPWCVRP